jgi:hypothetical protein
VQTKKIDMIKKGLWLWREGTQGSSECEKNVNKNEETAERDTMHMPQQPFQWMA